MNKMLYANLIWWNSAIPPPQKKKKKTVWLATIEVRKEHTDFEFQWSTYSVRAIKALSKFAFIQSIWDVLNFDSELQ